MCVYMCTSTHADHQLTRSICNFKKEERTKNYMENSNEKMKNSACHYYYYYYYYYFICLQIEFNERTDGFPSTPNSTE